MTKIIQTQVNKDAINKIETKMASLISTIHEAESEIEKLERKKEELMTTYFCGKKILYEEERNLIDEYKRDYTIAVILRSSGKHDFKIHAHVHRDMSKLNEELYCARVEEHGVNWHSPDWYSGYGRKSKDGFKSFEEAKETARMWLAEIIEEYGDKP